VDVGATDADVPDIDEDVVGAGRRSGTVLQFELRGLE